MTQDLPENPTAAEIAMKQIERADQLRSILESLGRLRAQEIQGLREEARRNDLQLLLIVDQLTAILSAFVNGQDPSILCDKVASLKEALSAQRGAEMQRATGVITLAPGVYKPFPGASMEISQEGWVRVF